VLRDNRSLRLGSIQFQGGWSLSDLLIELNSRVFFWAGTENGPIKTGRLHFRKYELEGAVFMLRVPTISFVAANDGSQLWVTRCNSGSARHQKGKPIPRGPTTFQLPQAADFRPSQVIELSYVAEAKLPGDAQWSKSLSGPWYDLSDGG
jgi:hypothetical protein